MQFTISAATLMALVAQAMAQTADFDPIYTPNNGEVVHAGESFKINWKAPAKYANEKIKISLIGGATQNTQVPLQDIASGIDNGAETYQWSVDSSLGEDAVYGLVIKLESNPDVFQYSMPFKIEAGEAKPQSSAAVTSAPAASADTTLTASQGVATVSLSSAAAGGPEVIVEKVTQMHTITSCAPEVTNCPARTETHVVPVSSAPAVSVSSAPAPPPAPPAVETSVPFVVPQNTSAPVVPPVHKPTVPVVAKPSTLIYNNQTTLATKSQSNGVPTSAPVAVPTQGKPEQPSQPHQPNQPSQPAIVPPTQVGQAPPTTPIATPPAVTAGAARMGAPIAIVGGLILAALAF